MVTELPTLDAETPVISFFDRGLVARGAAAGGAIVRATGAYISRIETICAARGLACACVSSYAPRMVVDVFFYQHTARISLWLATVCL